jgi:hypothetical protein
MTIQGGRQATETARETHQLLDLTDLKVTIINIFRELKPAMFKEVIEDIITMLHQMENICTEVEVIF